jgi:hypothetical protein
VRPLALAGLTMMTQEGRLFMAGLAAGMRIFLTEMPNGCKPPNILLIFNPISFMIRTIDRNKKC